MTPITSNDVDQIRCDQIGQAVGTRWRNKLNREEKVKKRDMKMNCDFAPVQRNQGEITTTTSCIRKMFPNFGQNWQLCTTQHPVEEWILCGKSWWHIVWHNTGISCFTYRIPCIPCYCLCMVLYGIAMHGFITVHIGYTRAHHLMTHLRRAHANFLFFIHLFYASHFLFSSLCYSIGALSGVHGSKSPCL